jgi:hypothetical protein
MANTLTNLIPDLYAALDIVSRELVGMIPAVTMDAQVTRAAIGQVVRIPLTAAPTASDAVPAVTPPNDGDQTIGNTTVTISKSRRAAVRWTGEEQRALDNNGPGYRSILQNQFAQAMRVLTNEIETDLAALYTRASRAYGTAGTTPFGTGGDYSDAAQVRKILVDNGAPVSDLQLVLNTQAGATIRGKQAQVQMVGDQSLLRQGVLLDMHGFTMRESAQIKNVTKGTGASYTTTAAGFAVGTTSIPLITGTGAILAGDIVTFAGDTNKYMVATGISAPGTLVLAAPGLRQAIPAAATAVTVGNSFTANLAFSRGSILLAARAPTLPAEGDMATDRMMITDPKSNLSFEVSVYPQYLQVLYDVRMAWGVACIKPENLAVLLG